MFKVAVRNLASKLIESSTCFQIIHFREENYLIEMPKNRLHDRDEVSVGGEVGDIEQPFELLQGNGDGSASHEPYNGCMGQKLGDKAQPVQTNICSFSKHGENTRLSR